MLYVLRFLMVLLCKIWPVSSHPFIVPVVCVHVAMRVTVRCGGIFYNPFIANILLIVSVKDFLKIGQYLMGVMTKLGGFHFWPLYSVNVWTEFWVLTGFYIYFLIVTLKVCSDILMDRLLVDVNVALWYCDVSVMCQFVVVWCSTVAVCILLHANEELGFRFSWFIQGFRQKPLPQQRNINYSVLL